MAAQMSTRLALQRTFLASPAYTRALRRNNTHYLPAIALFVAQHSRSIATETHSNGAPLPPPGFNIKDAQKPLPKERAPAKTSQVAPLNATTQAVTQDPLPHAQPEDVHTKDIALTGKSEDRQKEIEKAKDKKEAAKLTVWQKVKKEASHFWDGTKLLGVEIKISSKLAVKMAAGYDLSRREHRQLQRTVKDIVRLVPFSMFVIVPFAELLLPVAIKLFPNMLPSTYEAAQDREKKSSILRATRKDTSNLLKTTILESGLPLSRKTREREEFAKFFSKVRTSGEQPSHADVIAVCQTFKDDVTLDNLSRAQLVGMCRYMNLNAFGTDMMLRYTIRHRMRQIKRDDRAIFMEGVQSLSVPELQTACASRGMRTHGISPAHLRDDLTTWLDLRLKHKVPSTLLVLSNAFMYTQGKEGEIESHYDALIAVLSSIPEELFHEIELDLHTAEGAATNKQRLEVLKEQQELIEEENEQAGDGGGTVSSKLDQDIDDKEDKESKMAAAESAKGNEALTEAAGRHEGEKESPSDLEVEKEVDERRAKEAKEADEKK